jgi:PAS domain S-box-containing protein
MEVLAEQSHFEIVEPMLVTYRRMLHYPHLVCSSEMVNSERLGSVKEMPAPVATDRASSTFGVPALTNLSTVMLEELFDHLPETAFFLKDTTGRYVVVNQSLVERCGLRFKRELVGRHVRDIFPAPLGERYAAQDASVLRTGRPIVDRLELHWYARRRADWCLTTKLPIRDAKGRITGLIGISRDIRAPGDRSKIPPSLLGTLDELEQNLDITPAGLAQTAGLSSVRFARLIRRIFRLTPSQLITQTRLAAASQMLKQPESSIVEIAHACGFSDHSAFTRAFRAATGLTPSQYRKQE